MDYQVRFNFEDRQNKALDIARTEDEFNKTTILQLKKKLKQKIPGAPDADKLMVIFGKDPLEDEQTLGFYQIKRLSVLLFVMKMPGGGVCEDMDSKDHTQVVHVHFSTRTSSNGVYGLLWS